jgi:hypothetical protein
VGLQQRLLHHAGQIELALQPRIHVEAGQEGQVLTEAFQRPVPVLGRAVHDAHLKKKRERRQNYAPENGKIFREDTAESEGAVMESTRFRGGG